MFVRKNYILNLRYHVPKNVLDKRWLRPPGILENVRTPLGLVLQGAWARTELLYLHVDLPGLGGAALAAFLDLRKALSCTFSCTEFN